MDRINAKIPRDASRERLCTALFPALTAALFFLVAICSPWSSDDWIYIAKNQGHMKDFIEYALYYGNGRFLGNLFAMCFVQKPLLNALFKTVIVTGVVFLLPRVCRVRTGRGSALSFLLLFGMPAALFAQVLQWTSGFMNYTPPIFCMLLCLYLFGAFSDAPDSPGISALKATLLFFASFCGQLFVEHATFINVLLAAGLLILALRKKQKRGLAAAYALGALLGAAAMAAIPRVFFDPYNTQLVYRSFSLGGPAALFSRAAANLLVYARYFESCTLLIAALGALGFAVLARSGGAGGDARTKSVCRIALLSCSVYSLLSTLLFHNLYVMPQTWPRDLVSLGFLIAFLAALFYAFSRLADANLRQRVLALLVLAVLSVCPLLVATVTVERCLLLPYCLLTMAALTLLDALYDGFPEALYRALHVCFAAGAAALTLCLVFTFLSIRALNDMQIGHIEAKMAAGADEIDVFEMPYEYVFGGDDTWTYGQVYYKEVRKDVKFDMITFERWYARRQRELE